MKKWWKHATVIIGIIFFSFLMHFYFLQNDIYFTHSGGDPIDQYIKFQWFLYENMRNLNFEWSWLHGLGGDMYGEFAYYYMTSPFFLLNLLFDYDNIQQMVDVKLYISVLKMTLAGVFFYAYMQYLKKSKIASVLGVLLYLGTLNFIYISFYSDFMSDAFVYLPLAVWGLDVLVKKGKPLLFIFSVFLMIQSNFYFGYITTIFLIIYTLVLYFTQIEKKSIKTFFQFGWPIAGSYLVGLLLASYSFIPAVYQFFDAYRFSKVYEIPLFFGEAFYKNLTSGLFFNVSYVTIPAIFLLILPAGLFMKKKTLKAPLVTAIIVLAFYLIPKMYSVFNGFSAMQDRWYYLLFFAFAVLVVYITDEWLKGQNISWVSYVLYYAAFIAYLYALSKPDMYALYYTENTWGRVIFVIHLLAPIFFLIKKVSARRWILSGMILVVAVQSVIMSNIYFEVRQGDPLAYKKQVTYILEHINHEDKEAVAEWLKDYDSSFYRVQWYRSYEQMDGKWFNHHNDSMIYDLPTTASYQSLLSKNIGEFIYEDQHILQFDSFSHFYNLDERPVLQSFLQAKYILVPGGLDYQPKGYTLVAFMNTIKVYQLNNSLPFAYVLQNQINESDYDFMTAAEKEELLLKAYVTEDAQTNFNPSEVLQSEVLIDGLNDASEIKARMNKDLLTLTEETTFTLPLDRVPSDQEELLLSIAIEEVNGNEFLLNANGKNLLKRATSHTYSLPIKRFVMNLDTPFTEAELSLTLTAGTYKIKDFLLESIPLSTLEEEVETLNENGYELTGMNKSYVELTGSTDQKGMLVTSIPYSSGWTAKVNGEKIETKEINSAFVGIPLTEGEHLIQLEYDTPFSRIGIIISLITLVSIVIVSLVVKKRVK